jgi:hypothetical protein
LAGVLFVIWGYVHRSSAPWYFDAMALALSFVVPALFLVGLAGLYALCAKRVGRIGRIGLMVGLLGSAIGAAYAAPWSALATAGSELAPLAWLDTVLVWWLDVLLTGLPLVGVAAVETRAFRGLGVFLLAMGASGWAYYFTDSGSIADSRLVHVAFGLVFGLSWMGLGFVLLSEET